MGDGENRNKSHTSKVRFKLDSSIIQRSSEEEIYSCEASRMKDVPH